MVASAEDYQNSLCVERTIQIEASLDIAYETLLEQLGPAADFEGTPMPMKFEAWPGGRWFRDLGDDTGHWWGHVQVIKPPTLIEISGPLFMSYPALSHVQYRLTAGEDGTTLSFVHRAVGELEAEHCRSVNQGWDHQLGRIKSRAEKA